MHTNEPASRPAHFLTALAAAGMWLVFLAASCAPLPAAAPTEPLPTASPAGREPLILTVLHTNDTWGYLTPCG